jgi:hypothetical protein
MHSGGEGFINPDIRDALMTVAGRDGMLNAKVLGNWLQAQQDRIVDGLQFVRMGDRQGVAVWALKRETPKSAV